MKDIILQALRQKQYVSGEQLGRSLGVSRTTVWKTIKELRAQGYGIASSPGRGYTLKGVPDTLTPAEIRSWLRTRTFGHRILYHPEASSTQDIAQSLAALGAASGTVVVAERQTGGRGRLGRMWASLPGGMAFSMILRPQTAPSQAARFTIMAGVAVAQAISRMAEVHPQLKWPNDIFLGEKKAGGILTEMSAEADRVNHMVIGIGLNVNTQREDFPPAIAEIATSIRAESGRKTPRAPLLAAILENLEALEEEFTAAGFAPLRQKWREFSNTLGRRVRVTGGIGPEIEGTAADMAPDGALIVEDDEGVVHKIIAGDVSLRNI